MKQSKTRINKKHLCYSCKLYDIDCDKCGFNGEPDILKSKVTECGTYEKIDGRKRRKYKNLYN